MSGNDSKSGKKFRYEKPVITDLGGTGNWVASTGQYFGGCRTGVIGSLNVCATGVIGG